MKRDRTTVFGVEKPFPWLLCAMYPAAAITTAVVAAGVYIYFFDDHSLISF